MEQVPVPRPLVASNGHGPDLNGEHAAALGANGKADGAGNGVPFGATLPVSESSLELREGEK